MGTAMLTHAWRTKRPVAVNPWMKPIRRVGRGETMREALKQMRAHCQAHLLVFFLSITKTPT